MPAVVFVDEGARLWLLGLTVLWAVDAGIRWFKWMECRCPAETADPEAMKETV